MDYESTALTAELRARNAILARQQAFQKLLRGRIAFFRSPNSEFLIRSRFPRPRLHLITNYTLGNRDHGMPNTRRQIDAPTPAAIGLVTQSITRRHISRLIEDNQVRHAIQHKKSF